MTRSTNRVTTSWTCAVVGVRHEVADVEFAARRDDVQLPAICGEFLVPRSVELPNDGRPCRRCRAILAAPVAHIEPPPRKVYVDELYRRPDVVIPRQDRRSHRRRSTWSRLMHRPTCEVAVAEVLAAARPEGTAPAEGAADIPPRAQATPSGAAGAEKAA